MADNTPQPTTIAGVERALTVLTLFSRDGVADLGVTEIAERLGYSKAVVHRILASCRAQGYVELDESTRRYRLGPSALQLGLSYLNRIDVMSETGGALQEISRRTSETATHSVRAGWHRVYVGQVTPPRDIKMVVQIGGSYPLHSGASGKVILAHLPAEVRDAYLKGPELLGVTGDTIVDVGALAEELEGIRESGFAVSFGERLAGAGSAAAPALDHRGQVVAGISVCGPLDRFREHIDECTEVLLEVTANLSARIGHRQEEGQQDGGSAS